MISLYKLSSKSLSCFGEEKFFLPTRVQQVASLYPRYDRWWHNDTFGREYCCLQCVLNYVTTEELHDIIYRYSFGFRIHKFKLSTPCKVEFNNCPIRCDLFSLLYFCGQLYMFRVLTSIIRSSYNCNYSFCYWLTGSTNIRSHGC